MHLILTHAVDVEIPEPYVDVFKNEIPYRYAIGIVEVERASPRGIVFISEIGAELGKMVSFRAHMVLHHIQNDGNVFLVTFIYQLFQFSNTPVTILGGKGIDTVIAPVSAARKLGDRHDFDGVNSQLLQII